MSGMKKRTRPLTVTAVLTALSLALLYGSSISPAARLGLTAAAGLVPAGAVISAGLAYGFCCYGITGLLGLLLVPVKGNVILYLLFFGLYPMIKSMAERLRSSMAGWVCKLIFFNLILAFCWFGLQTLFLPFLPKLLTSPRLLWLAGNAAFVIYDIGFSKLIAFYIGRIDKVLRKST